MSITKKLASYAHPQRTPIQVGSKVRFNSTKHGRVEGRVEEINQKTGRLTVSLTNCDLIFDVNPDDCVEIKRK